MGRVFTAERNDRRRARFAAVAALALALGGIVGAGALGAQKYGPSSDERSEDWHWVVSPHFRILTDAEPWSMARTVSNLERFRAAFARLAPGMRLHSPVPVRMIAFASHRSYAPYKNPPDPRILGQFVRSLDGHHLTFHAGATDDYSVDYHEYVHYLVDGNVPAAPRWFHEGLAEYYSTFEADEETVTVGLPVLRHLRWFAGDADADLRDLSYEFSVLEVLNGRAAHDGDKVGGFYAFSWALVHYLLSGPDERLVQTADFLAALADGEEAGRAFE
ncbi:MAG: hypothetical protein AAFX50_14685, partial [Acidobacteriota bacterium]